MGIISKTAKVKIGSRNFKYYKKLGYDFEHRGDEIEVKIRHLPKHTKEKVVVLCDICNTNKMLVGYCDYNRSVENTGSYVCKDCASKKRAQTNQVRYGVLSVSQLPEIKEKVRQTNISRYGVDNYSKTQECREKIRQTCLQAYNVEHHLQCQDVKNKRYKTNFARYGYKHTLSVPDIRERINQTFFERYGIYHPSQLPEFREKATQTLYANSSQKTSRQQFYLFNLYKSTDPTTELNYPISRFNADICLPNEKIDIEVDFGGHNLSVKTGKLTQEEFDQKEIIRNNIIKREGYKQIRIISSKDLLPSDSTLLQMLSEAKQYFSEYPNHSWYEYNLDISLVRNAEHRQGIPYDFGTLRRIKDDDLTKIETQNNINTKKGA